MAASRLKARADGRIGFSPGLFLRSMRPVSPKDATASRERKQKFRQRTGHARHADIAKSAPRKRDDNIWYNLRQREGGHACPTIIVQKIPVFTGVPPAPPSRSWATVHRSEKVPRDCEGWGLTCPKYCIQLEGDRIKAVSPTVNVSRYCSNIAQVFTQLHFLRWIARDFWATP
jgi:hypothetical protein